jgi:hypothetical protein
MRAIPLPQLSGESVDQREAGSDGSANRSSATYDLLAPEASRHRTTLTPRVSRSAYRSAERSGSAAARRAVRCNRLLGAHHVAVVTTRLSIVDVEIADASIGK